jgi:hypothetical protein
VRGADTQPAECGFAGSSVGLSSSLMSFDVVSAAGAASTSMQLDVSPPLQIQVN